MIWVIYVRFTPESGHVRCNQGCPLWANSESKIKLPSPEDRRERIHGNECVQWVPDYGWVNVCGSQYGGYGYW